MKLPNKFNSRIALLIFLAITQVSLVYHFCVHRNLEGFLFGSSITILLFATLFWIGWLVRHGVTNFEVCMVIGGGAGALVFWQERNIFLSVAFASADLIFAIILLRRLLSPVDIDKQEENLNAYQTEANSVSPIKRHTSALIAYAILGGIIWFLNGFEFPPYGNFLFILALCDISMLIYHIIKDKRTKSTDDPSIESITDQGGRA